MQMLGSRNLHQDVPPTCLGMASVAGLTRPSEGEVPHFSEDTGITVFVPHVARTAIQPEAYVWAVNSEHSPSYWLPRACPRILTRASPRTSPADRERFLGVSPRVHAIEYSWLAAMQSTEL